MGVSKKKKAVEKAKKAIRSQFCIVIVSPALQLLKLELPRKFVKNHGKHMLNPVYLRVPNGRDWPVELLKHNGNAWLHRGWSQFAERYSIVSAYVLVFRYDGSSRFRVQAFDITALEIKYSHAYTLRVPKVEKTEEDDEQRTKDTSNDMLDETQQPFEGESSNVESAEDRVLRRANAFRSRNPFFITRIQKRNLSYNSGPMFPTSHCKTYFKEIDGDDKAVTLCVDNNTWNVKHRMEKDRKISLAAGWKEFVLDNHLKEGDACVYELTDSSKKAYNVHIFRISDKMDEPTIKEEEIEGDGDDSIQVASGRSGEEGKMSCIVDEAYAFVGNSPGFIINIADLRLSVCVPFSHAEKYLQDKGGDHNVIVVRGKEGKAWKMKYETETCKSIAFGSWSEFGSDNRLETDDICAFKLIDANRKVYRVGIFRANGK